MRLPKVKKKECKKNSRITTMNLGDLCTNAARYILIFLCRGPTLCDWIKRMKSLKCKVLFSPRVSSYPSCLNFSYVYVQI